jgi:glucose/arabinose dehydrogenase
VRRGPVRTAVVVAALGVALGAALAACSSSSKTSKSATPATPTTATTAAQTADTSGTGTPTSDAAATETTGAQATEGPTTTEAPPQNVTITPDTGLKDGQTVHIVGTGFTAGTSYSAFECADKGTGTTPDDCDLGVAKVAAADSAGTVTIDFPVHKGPFGGNKIVCSASQKCLITVTNAGGGGTTTQVATGDIGFAS